MVLKSKTHILQNYLGKHPSYEGFELKPDNSLGLIVVIPVYKERDYLFHTIDSLLQCYKPDCGVEVIFVFNSSESDDLILVSDHKEMAQDIRNSHFPLFPEWFKPVIIEADNLPRKHFGAGLARKIGMDAATAHFNLIDKSEGIIVTLDSDTLVMPNYFQAISEWFNVPKRNGASIYFEHPVKGSQFPVNIYDGIIKYELHLRYYMQALRYCGFPYSFHTMGSAMAMRAQAYARIGGMPRKQAGEDFYFLQKLIPLGGFGEINSTSVFPSPRPSDRVIFGTGAAIKKHMSGDDYVESTYNFQAFLDLKDFLSKKQELFNISNDGYESWSYCLSGPMRSFLLNSSLFSEIDVLKVDCSSEKVFNKRFFDIFNAFKIVKYLNYVHSNFFSKMPVFDAATTLLNQLGHDTDSYFTELELLVFYRELEKKYPFLLS